MSDLAATRSPRGELTLAAIVDAALEQAAAEGIESLTVGSVAARTGLSRSGVFSRIGSREALLRAVIEEYERRFLQDVFVPATREPRGLPRLDAIVRNWLRRAEAVELRTGCIYCSGAFELDDREGPLRDLLLSGYTRWRAALRRAVQQAIDEGHLREDTDATQFAYELDGLFLNLMREARFLRDPRAVTRTQAAWERLVESHRPAAAAPSHRR